MPRRHRPQPFTAVVAALPAVDPGAPAAEPVVSLLAARTWTDADGTTWTRRGGDLPVRRVRRLLGDATVRVVEVSPEGVQDVAPADRGALWEDVGARLRDVPREAGDHLDVRAGEFRAPSGGRLLVVEERC